MSAVHLPPGPRIPPLGDRPVVEPTPPDPSRNPSLRWRIRRWILKKLDMARRGVQEELFG